jgi:hypothetical protein
VVAAPIDRDDRPRIIGGGASSARTVAMVVATAVRIALMSVVSAR